MVLVGGHTPRLVDGLGALFTVLGTAALLALPWRER
jgi:hypothetical protein